MPCFFATTLQVSSRLDFITAPWLGGEMKLLLIILTLAAAQLSAKNDDSLLRIPTSFPSETISTLAFARQSSDKAFSKITDEMLQASITKVFSQYRLKETPSTPTEKGFLTLAVDQVGPSYRIELNYIRTMRNWDGTDKPVSVWSRSNMAIDINSTQRSILDEVENQLSLFCAAYIRENTK